MARSILLFLLLTILSTTQALKTTTTCPKLLQHYKRNAIRRVGPYGFSPSIPFARQPTVALPESAQSADTRNPPQAGVDFSETNVQVEGVDEPDVVKTDGKRVYTLRGNTFFIVKVTKSGASGKRTGEITLSTPGREMLIHRNRVLIISQVFQSLHVQPRPITSSLIRPFPARSVTVIYQISIAGPKPKLLATLRMDGRYISSREVNGIARIILKFDPVPIIPFLFPTDRSPRDTTSVTNANKEVVRRTTINTWLPRYHLTTRCSNPDCPRHVKGLLTKCNRVFLPTDKFTGFGLLTVVTLKLSGIIRPRKSISIASDAGDVYATATSLYVATTQYRYDFTSDSRLLGPTFKTFLHKFQLRPNGATFVGTGQVLGSVLNQFSMHENNDVFFVATTEGAPWWRGRDTSKSKVTSFRVRRGKLVKIGQVGNLGIGERIFAVRYIVTTAYVVTFRQIDPLYIIDLSNPRKLRVTGELKIPGFSSYLHPIADGRILGVGQEATLDGRTTGAKVSLFDVSDVRNPKEIAAWTLKGSFTTAQFDHRAFLWWKPESIAVLPVSVFSRDVKDRFIGSVVLNVSDEVIEERGRIVHEKCCGATFSPRIERNFVIGRTHLWSLSRELLQINSITDLVFEGSVKVSGKTVVRPIPGPVVV